MSVYNKPDIKPRLGNNTPSYIHRKMNSVNFGTNSYKSKEKEDKKEILKSEEKEDKKEIKNIKDIKDEKEEKIIGKKRLRKKEEKEEKNEEINNEEKKEEKKEEK